jgi:hypothetical protein
LLKKWLSADVRIPSGIVEKEIKVLISSGGRSSFQRGRFLDQRIYLTAYWTTNELKVRLIEEQGFLFSTVHTGLGTNLTFCPVFAGRTFISGKVPGVGNWSVIYVEVNNMWTYRAFQEE